MPASPGENHLVTLFADVHYYFSDPQVQPQHHRFSRGSYVYLFNNASEHHVKLEIANHAGTPDQDAFSGYLEHISRLNYSYKQPTLFTFTIDGGDLKGHQQWHLPSYNQRNEQKYLYKINTIDVYLWTEKDAASFLTHLHNLLPSWKLKIKDAPANLPAPAEHRDSMSPVVQQLEKTAIGAQFPPRAESTYSAHSVPGPPTPSGSLGGTTSPQPTQAAPMAYNPAAPAAPEPIAHREKTPPPSDGPAGTGLSGPGNYNTMPQQQYANVPHTYSSSGQPTPQEYYTHGQPVQQQHARQLSFPGPPVQGTPPQATASASSSLPPPPPPGPGQHQPILSPPNKMDFNRQSSFGSVPGQTQYANYPQKAPSFGPSAIASPGLPGTPGYAPSQQPPTPSAPPAYSGPGQYLSEQSQPQQQQPGFPSQQQQSEPQSQQQQHGFKPAGQDEVFAYGTYNYSQPQAPPQDYNPANPNAGYVGDMHSQVYRPTTAEANSHGHGHGHGKPAHPPRQNSSDSRHKLEGKVTQVEAGVGKFMKRLDKLW